MTKQIWVHRDDKQLLQTIEESLHQFAEYEFVLSNDNVDKNLMPSHYTLAIVDLDFVHDFPSFQKQIALYTKQTVIVGKNETELSKYINEPYGLWFKPVSVMTIRNELMYLLRHYQQITDFMGYVSHELKNPLSSMIL